MKFHFKTLQDMAAEMKGKNPDHAQSDLVEAIDRKDFPRWGA